LRERGAEQAVLLPVNVSRQEMPAHAGPKPAMAAVAAGVIEIDIGAARVRLRGAVDEANVRCVLQVLRAIA
jgi:transposase